MIASLRLVQFRFIEKGWIQQDFSGLVQQWGYRDNAVDASSTTHNGGGVFDIRFSMVETDAKLRVWQECGIAPFRRRPPAWSSSVHGHMCVIGCDHKDQMAKDQVDDFYNGLNGLKSHARYDGPIYVKRTWQEAQDHYASFIEEMSMPSTDQIADEVEKRVKRLIDDIAKETKRQLILVDDWPSPPNAPSAQGPKGDQTWAGINILRNPSVLLYSLHGKVDALARAVAAQAAGDKAAAAAAQADLDEIQAQLDALAAQPNPIPEPVASS